MYWMQPLGGLNSWSKNKEYCHYLLTRSLTRKIDGPGPYWLVKLKVKVTVVQALRLCTGRTAHRGSRGIALPFLDHGTRREWGDSVTPRPLFTAGKDPVPIVQEAGWAPEPIWTGADNLAPTGILSTDRPVRSQSLYWMNYPAHNKTRNIILLRVRITIIAEEKQYLLYSLGVCL
jgi:hypothetical protein